jgi:hypothetical protein
MTMYLSTRPPRLVTVAFVALTALLAACGGSSRAPSATPTSAVVESHAADALTRSAAGTAAATSFSTTFHADIVVDGKTIAEDGQMALRAPSSMYMKMTVAGQVVEILAVLPDEYMNVPGKGWYSLGDYVLNGDAYAKYAKNRGPVDYAGIVKGLKESRQLDDDTIDGKRYQHYTGTFDINDAIDKVPQDVLKPGVADVMKSVGLQPGTMDAWIDQDTALPRRAAVDMSMTVTGKSLQMKMVMDYAGWNEPVDMPAVPKDARPYTELTGGLTPADMSYMLQAASWLQGVGKHMSSFANVPDKNTSDMTDEERAQVQALLDNFSNDVTALHQMAPTAHFQPSFDKFDAAMQDFKVFYDELEKELKHEGQADEGKALSAFKSGTSLIGDGAKLFASEAPAKP